MYALIPEVTRVEELQDAALASLWARRQRHHRNRFSLKLLRARLRNPLCSTTLTEKQLMTHLDALLFREIKRFLRTFQSEHGWTAGVSLMLRDRVCVKSHHTTIPPTSDASVGTQQIYDTTTRRLNGREADACCTGAYDDEFSV